MCVCVINSKAIGDNQFIRDDVSLPWKLICPSTHVHVFVQEYNTYTCMYPLFMIDTQRKFV